MGDVKIVSSVSTFGLNTLTFWAIMTFCDDVSRIHFLSDIFLQP